MKDLKPNFVLLPQLLQAHDNLLLEHGGLGGVRDVGSLMAAIQMPTWFLDHDYLYSFPFGMASAYMFFVANNHAFFDGNKRTALFATLVFLRMNGYTVPVDLAGELVELVVGVASNKVDKALLKQTLTGFAIENENYEDFESAQAHISTVFYESFRELSNR